MQKSLSSFHRQAEKSRQSISPVAPQDGWTVKEPKGAINKDFTDPSEQNSHSPSAGVYGKC